MVKPQRKQLITALCVALLGFFSFWLFHWLYDMVSPPSPNTSHPQVNTKFIFWSAKCATSWFFFSFFPLVLLLLEEPDRLQRYQKVLLCLYSSFLAELTQSVFCALPVFFFSFSFVLFPDNQVSMAKRVVTHSCGHSAFFGS